jgi:hypothetical protein
MTIIKAYLYLIDRFVSYPSSQIQSKIIEPSSLHQSCGGPSCDASGACSTVFEPCPEAEFIVEIDPVRQAKTLAPPVPPVQMNGARTTLRQISRNRGQQVIRMESFRRTLYADPAGDTDENLSDVPSDYG